MILLVACTPAFGQDANDVQSMDEMVVTATRTEERVIDVPVETQIITQDQIQMSGPWTSAI